MIRASRAAALASLPLATVLVAGCGGSSSSGVSGSGLGAVATPRTQGGAQVFAVTGTASLTFSPGELDAKPGKIRVDFAVEPGSPPHDFVVHGINGARTDIVSAGDKSSTSFTATTPGSYQVVCTIHSTMKGTLKIG